MKYLSTTILASVMVLMSFHLLFDNGLKAQELEHKSFTPQTNAAFNDLQSLGLQANLKSEKEIYYSMKQENGEWVKDEINNTKESLFNQDGYLTIKMVKNHERNSERVTKYVFNDKGERIKASSFHNKQLLSEIHFEDWLWVKNKRFKKNELYESKYYTYDEEKRLLSKLTYVQMAGDSVLLSKRLFEYKADGVCKVKDYLSSGMIPDLSSSFAGIEVVEPEIDEESAFYLFELTTYHGDMIKDVSTLAQEGNIQAKATFVYNEMDKLTKEYTFVFNETMVNDSTEKKQANMPLVIEYEYDARGNLVNETNKNFLINRVVITNKTYNNDNLVIKKETIINGVTSEINEYTYDENGSLKTSLQTIYEDGKEPKVTLAERSLQYH